MLKSTSKVCRSGAPPGEKPKLLTLFEVEETPLLRYAFSLTGRRAVAEEIVQEVFLKLHADWEAVELPRAWLYRAVRNRAISYLRTQGREVLESIQGDGQSWEGSGVSPADLLLQMEAVGLLREQVMALDASDRHLIELKYFAGLKYSEISERTGLSISNVGYRLHHILKTLAAKLRPLGIDGKS